MHECVLTLIPISNQPYQIEGFINILTPTSSQYPYNYWTICDTRCLCDISIATGLWGSSYQQSHHIVVTHKLDDYAAKLSFDGNSRHICINRLPKQDTRLSDESRPSW